jgi:hypothetical protein
MGSSLARSSWGRRAASSGCPREDQPASSSRSQRYPHPSRSSEDRSRGRVPYRRLANISSTRSGVPRSVLRSTLHGSSRRLLMATVVPVRGHSGWSPGASIRRSGGDLSNSSGFPQGQNILCLSYRVYRGETNKESGWAIVEDRASPLMVVGVIELDRPRCALPH